jgi:hypothetical protein
VRSRTPSKKFSSILWNQLTSNPSPESSQRCPSRDPMERQNREHIMVKFMPAMSRRRRPPSLPPTESPEESFVPRFGSTG